MEFIDNPRAAAVAINNKIGELQPKFTYFFERLLDKEIIPVDSRDAAWDMYKRGSRDFRYLGRTDGKLMFQAVKEAQEIFRKEGLAKAQERIRQGQQEEFARCTEDKTPPMQQDVFGNGKDRLLNNLSKYAH